MALAIPIRYNQLRVERTYLAVRSMAIPAQVLQDALSLSAEDRAEVARTLLMSLEPVAHDEEPDQEFAAEIRHRLQAIREGRVSLRDWDDALLDMRTAIQSSDRA